MSYMRKVVRVEQRTKVREISRKERITKFGGTVTVTTKAITSTFIILECGHARRQDSSEKDMRESKTLYCYECDKIDSHAAHVTV